MEKYSHFRDKATGIGPFFANPLNTPASTALYVAELAASAVSAVLRIPVIILTFAAVATASYAAPFLYASLLPLLQVLLLACGVSSWDVQTEGSKKKDARRNMPAPGSIIVSNFVSPLDPLIYYSFFDAIFVVPLATADGKDIVYFERSLASAVLWALERPVVMTAQDYATAPQHTTLPEYAARARASGKVVVVFGEGTPSNGKGLLPLLLSEPPATDAATDAAPLTYPTAIKYGRSAIATPTPRSPLAWLWTVVYGFQFGYVRVRFGVPLDGAEKHTAESSGPSAAASGLSIPASVVDDALSYKGLVSAGICRVGRLKEVGLGIEAKLEFIDVQNKKPAKPGKKKAK